MISHLGAGIGSPCLVINVPQDVDRGDIGLFLEGGEDIRPGPLAHTAVVADGLYLNLVLGAQLEALDGVLHLGEIVDVNPLLFALRDVDGHVVDEQCPIAIAVVVANRKMAFLPSIFRQVKGELSPETG